MNSAKELSVFTGKKAACIALCVPRASFYRFFADKNEIDKPCRHSPMKLSDATEQQVLDVLHEERFWDCSPYQIYATLLDEGVYLCSVRTMYRILAKHNEVKERRRQKRHCKYKKPELLATAPNQVWSWDITRLKGPEKWTYFQLYVIMDIYSRYVVGWMVAYREDSALAKKLIKETCIKQNIEQNQLTLHADRGSSMTSKVVSNLLLDLKVTRTHSRPHVSNDNPYSESQFKTLKYCPDFPQRFGSIEDARLFCRNFFDWYNHRHKHSGIAFLTPEQMHYGLEKDVISRRQQVLMAAFEANKHRFKWKMPCVQRPPTHVWINPPPSGQTV